MQVEFHEITSAEDPDWLIWKRIYLESFPESERMSEGHFLAVFEDRSSDEHTLSIRIDAETIGIAHYSEVSKARAAYLWYLAIQSGHRGEGIGSAVYEEWTVKLASRFDLVVFEVEMPERQTDEERRRLAQKRIDWYRKMGARLLEGIEYVQRVDTATQPTPMHLMAHTFVPLTAAGVFERMKLVFEGDVRQTGELKLT